MLYEGLSDEARETCVRKMCRTLSTMPQRKKTRDYVKSLTGERETPAQLRARANAAVKKAKADARAAAVEVAHRVIATAVQRAQPCVRKQRVSPFATRSNQWPKKSLAKMAGPKNCRPLNRYIHENVVADRMSRGWGNMEAAVANRRALVAAQGGLCAICGHDLRGEASLDHVIPRALSGANDLGNLVLAHGKCNGDKSNDVPTGCEMVWLLAVNARLGVLPVVF